MRKYYKILILPAVLIIVAGVFSGFKEQSTETLVKELLEERTRILQQGYYEKMKKEDAEEALSKIETYPLLSEDLQGLRDVENTDLDVVKSMELKNARQKSKMFDYLSFHVEIRWYMSGPEGDYITEGAYSVVMKSLNEGESWKLSEFRPEYE